MSYAHLAIVVAMVRGPESDVDMTMPKVGKAESGIFNVPVRKEATGLVLPGDTNESVVTVSPGPKKLSLVSMFALANDCFVSTPPENVDFFRENSTPIGGDIPSVWMMRVPKRTSQLGKEYIRRRAKLVSTWTPWIMPTLSAP